MNESLPREIHTILIPVNGGRLLLPNAAVAEIAPLAGLEPVEHAPPWLPGRMPWRDEMIPLVSFSRLARIAPAANDVQQTRVAVVKTLAGGKFAHIGLVAQGLPRLVTVTPDLLVRVDGGDELMPGVSAHVLVRSDQAIIPDLHWIEAKVEQALAA
jgi:chemosensory pili system protein ChpC